MSRRYVQLYDDLLASDAIITVGFGFQRDDGHVNGMFRQLIEDEGKQVFICDYTRGTFNNDEKHRFYRKKLRLSSDRANLEIIPVGSGRKVVGTGVNWLEEIASRL